MEAERTRDPHKDNMASVASVFWCGKMRLLRVAEHTCDAYVM